MKPTGCTYVRRSGTTSSVSPTDASFASIVEWNLREHHIEGGALADTIRPSSVSADERSSR